MKILVTGAAGFIGSNLCDFLLTRDYTVVGVDDFNNFYSPKIKEYNIKDFADSPKFKLYRIDITDYEALSTMFEKESNFDAVVHLAAWAGVTNSFEQPNVYIKNNLEGTVNLLELCKKSNTSNFIFASTSSVYGPNKVPFIESMNTDMPLAPYPATKKAGEVLLYVYSENFGINTTILRIFNPNGPRMRPDLALPKLVKSCLYGDEFPLYWNQEDLAKTGRDYCYVEHILESIDELIKNPQKYEVFNLGNSDPVTLADLIATVEKITGKKANLNYLASRLGEMQVTYANIDKAKKMIGYNPSTSIENIVSNYVSWFSRQEDWYKKYNL